MSDPLQQRIREAIANPKNLGELPGADAVGTVGSPDCGDMLRMWIKFKDADGRRVIDRATFQTFGCETAIAVASVATELIAGKTAEEALNLSGADLSAPLGALPPIKIH
jgi:nitrogen fixation NifU-like protein